MAIDFTSLDLQAVIGRGGMATVWRAQHRPSKTLVAVKVLHPDLLDIPNAHAQFLTEADVLGRLYHPNVVQLYGHGMVRSVTAEPPEDRLRSGAPYMVMEYFPQGTLNSAAPFTDWESVRSILLSILDALATAHAADLVHRDLKPSNILMGPRGPVLSDFGIVHDWSTVMSESETPSFGTPSYMPPEQILNQWRLYGPWTDLYALGCLTYWLCSGQTLLGVSATKMFFKVISTGPPPPLEANFEIPQQLQTWLFRCLDKNLRQRPQLAADAARELLAINSPLDVQISRLDRLSTSPDDPTTLMSPTLSTISLAHLMMGPRHENLQCTRPLVTTRRWI